MTWVRLESDFPNHPKVIAAGGDAALLFVAGLCYCNAHLTNGRIPGAVIPRLTDRKRPTALARRLVEVGMWTEDGDGYLVHDFLEYQPSADAVKAQRADVAEKRAAAGRMGGIASGIARSVASRVASSKNEANGKQNRSKTEAHTDPIRTNPDLTHTPRAGARVDADVAWSEATGTLCADLSALLDLRRHVDECAGKSDRDPDDLFRHAVAEFKAFRETCSPGKIPALSPRKLLEHWPTVWERIAGTAPKGSATASGPRGYAGIAPKTGSIVAGDG